MARTGIIVAQLGGPESLDDVERFMRAIFDDPRLVPLPGGARTRAVASRMISLIRRGKVRSNYEQIGGSSPIVATTGLQADLLEGELSSRGFDVVVTVAQRHSKPNTETAVKILMEAEVDRIVVLPLFPQYSEATTGSSEEELRRVLIEMNIATPLHIIRSWCEHPSYLNAQVEQIEQVLASAPPEELASALLVFSAHGLPLKMIKRGDPYVKEIEASVAGITDQLEVSIEHVLAYQSRVGPIKWVGPNVKDVVSSAAQNGKTWLCVIPISFVSENLETLHELDVELKKLATDNGFSKFSRIRCFDTSPMVGALLADVVEEHL